MASQVVRQPIKAVPREVQTTQGLERMQPRLHEDVETTLNLENFHDRQQGEDGASLQNAPRLSPCSGCTCAVEAREMPECAVEGNEEAGHLKLLPQVLIPSVTVP